jgi:hypothetical protein
MFLPASRRGIRPIRAKRFNSISNEHSPWQAREQYAVFCLAIKVALHD